MTKEITLPNIRIKEDDSLDYQVNVSSQPEDALWDAFLAETPGGHHVQTSLWAQVKASLGYQFVRVVISRQNRTIAGGAQMLIRRFPMIGNVGFVPKGPLITLKDPWLEELTIKELLQTAKSSGIRCLIVQPPNHNEPVVSGLEARGFRPINISLAPTASIVLDLHKDLNVILGEMRRSTRYNISLGKRKGIIVRQGTEADLHTFYKLLSETSRRKQFSIYPARYYEKLWRVFHPYGLVHLFIAELEGEVVSAQLPITFGDTVINKLSAWSGQHGKLGPNEALYWAVIEWAKANGYRYYDLEGIDEDTAREITENKKNSGPLESNVTSFKIGFGGDVSFSPGPYLYITASILHQFTACYFQK
jgi:lipid II:glycine glycyltransferase (peptidoglycan interpeptide bridge formation enzyme)